MHTCITDTIEVEAGELKVQNHPKLHSNPRPGRHETLSQNGLNNEITTAWLSLSPPELTTSLASEDAQCRPTGLGSKNICVLVASADSMTCTVIRCP